MSTVEDPYVTWDAAYVLGALSPEDRRTFEEHLASCAVCQQGVAEVAGLPGLLAQVAPEDAAIWSAAPPADPASTPPETLLPSLITQSRSHRRRTVTVLLGVAAGLVLLLGGIGIGVGVRGLPAREAPERLAFSAVVPSSMTAVVDVASVSGGTRLQVECQYGGATQTEPGREYPAYSIVVVDEAEHSTRVKDWHVRPNKVMHPQGITQLRMDQIRRIEIRRTDTDQPLLQTTLR